MVVFSLSLVWRFPDEGVSDGDAATERIRKTKEKDGETKLRDPGTLPGRVIPPHRTDDGRESRWAHIHRLFTF